MADENRRCFGVVRVRSGAVAKNDGGEKVVWCDWRRDLKLGSLQHERLELSAQTARW